ncbi:LAMI_0H14202g1_1 [Lachancea mirantina]|uniref:Exocyst complex protein EXO70 n=1 Tax=Lachancea mirantina TaxID=1230905 RepID=A0A1G4KI24_9SACH|nr:LAMI_0H14202g1_1 [Lachancea mirantina]
MVEVDVDEADVLVLRQKLKNFSELSNQIEVSLTSIGRTTAQCSALFTPIINSSALLATLQRNIESSIESVSSIKDVANEASKHEIVLSQGLEQVGLKAYIKAIYKLEDITEDMESQQKGHAESVDFEGVKNHLRELIRDSENSLHSYFTGILNKIEPFDPQICMNKKQAFPYYEDDDILKLAALVDYFEASGRGSISDVVIGGRNQLIVKSLAFLEPFAKQITTKENIPYTKGSSGLIGYSDALVGFIANEYAFTEEIYAKQPKSQPIVFSKIIQPVLMNFIKIVNINLSLVKKSLSHVGLFCFELKDCVDNVLRILRGKPLNGFEPLVSAGQEIKLVLQSLFKELVQYIDGKAESLSQLPSDNGVTESTVDAMSRLRKFSEYKTGCLSAIEGMPRASWLPSDFQEKAYTFQGLVTDDPRALISCFFSDCIDCLIISLERRAQRILMPHQEPEIGNPQSSRNTHKQRIGFFLITNITLVEQIVSRSELSSVLSEQGKARLEKLKDRYVAYFISDWRSLTANLLDAVFVDSTGKVSSKDKDQIKEKFKKFNDGFEELASNFKHFRITDPAMKKLLQKEITSLVMPLYERFYGRYKDTFKNPRKHIKYTPNELMSVINSLGR